MTINAETESLIRDSISRLQPDWDDVTDIGHLSGGYSNENYTLRHDGERYVLRMPERQQPFVDRHRELAWFNLLPEGITVKPVVLDVETGQMLTPWVEGELLVDAWSTFEGADLVSYLQRLHEQLPDTDVVYDVGALVGEFWTGPAPVSATPLPVDTVPCHNDLNPWNVIVRDDDWITIDWEFAGRNDPLFDLVTLHQGLELSDEELPSLAGTFLNVAPEHIMERLNNALINFWVRELGWAEFQLRSGNTREEVREQVATAKSKLQALA